MLDIFESNKKRIGDPGGFCALWTVWYVDMRITYKTLKPKDLVNVLIKAIRTQNISVKNMIRNYAVHIIKDRDEILNKVGIDINDWLNDQYNDTHLDEIIKNLQYKIEKIQNDKSK